MSSAPVPLEKLAQSSGATFEARWGFLSTAPPLSHCIQSSATPRDFPQQQVQRSAISTSTAATQRESATD
jgi:hypothetical protein